MTKKEKKEKIKEEKKLSKKNAVDDKILLKKSTSKKSKLKKEKPKKPKVGFFRRILNFFKEIKSELKKIVWPKKDELFKSTSTVMFVIIIMTLFVVLADKTFHSLLKLLIKNLWCCVVFKGV